MDPREPHKRRQFLKLAVATVTTAACAPAPVGASAEAFDTASAGNVSGLAVGQIRPVDGVSAAIARDAKGLYAMTLTCTHQGCDMSGGVSSSRISCRCHGSQFSANGEVLQGPANQPLQHFAVTVDAQGEITVHGAEAVAADVRTAV
jgi:cytochrome b6-f complex iron-sulfur subunit